MKYKVHVYVGIYSLPLAFRTYYPWTFKRNVFSPANSGILSPLVSVVQLIGEGPHFLFSVLFRGNSLLISEREENSSDRKQGHASHQSFISKFVRRKDSIFCTL